MTKHDSKDRFTASEDKHGDWLVFDNEDFYCCYGPTNEHDAVSEAIRLNGNKQESELVELRKKNAELESHNLGLTKTLVEIEKELAIRDLEQQLKVADSFLNMSQVSGRFGRGAISEADAMRKRNKIFKELQQLKGGAK